MQNGHYAMSKDLPNKKSAIIPENDVIENLIGSLENFQEDWNVLKGIGYTFKKDQIEKELVYFKPEGKSYQLTYHVKVYPNLAEHYEYFIDAESGDIIRQFSTICNMAHHKHSDKCNHQEGIKSMPPVVSNGGDLLGMNRQINTYEEGSVYFMIDASRDMFNAQLSNFPDDPVGTIWTIDLNDTSPIGGNGQFTHVASASNNWSGQAEGVSAHYNAGIAYEYYKNTFNRESISGDGQNILSVINVADEDGSSLGNAFWNGLGIFYGNGDNAFFSLGRGLDVAGHEMSHGVVQTTADLEYYGESGALNESFADIFGAMIDRDDWQIGEDVVKTSAFPSGALRDMSDPGNGWPVGQYFSGWQPSHYDDRFLGTEDNAGVHINSGIPNHAYYLFAQQVGKDVAEQVFYRALSVYLTRSSKFEELRYAVVQSAGDLYNTSVINAARNAFDQVGIIGESEGDFQQDFEANPGDEFIILSAEDQSALALFDVAAATAVFNPLSTTNHISKPSITDDGEAVVFVGDDNHIHLILIDWMANPPTAQESILSSTPEWRNVVVSKNGRFVAALTTQASNEIIIFDFATNPISSNVFTLYNPTFTEGLSTGEVQYADAMEFDPTSTYLMYDALNLLESPTSGTIEFWDVGFVDVWNESADTWALGNIDKLFGALPEGVSVGNPTFSKNSPYIIAMDLLEEGQFAILGVNLETRDLNQITQNTDLGYPSYSSTDDFLVYDLSFFGYTDLGILQLGDDKISSIANTENIYAPSTKWGVWFSNGERILSQSEELTNLKDGFQIYPNPGTDFIKLSNFSSGISGDVKVDILNSQGQLVRQFNRQIRSAESLDIPVYDIEPNAYFVKVSSKTNTSIRPFVKK